MQSVSPRTPSTPSPALLASPPRKRLIRLPEVINTTGLARSTLYDLIARGGFPAQVPLVGNNVAWVESEVLDWVDARIAARFPETHA